MIEIFFYGSTTEKYINFDKKMPQFVSKNNVINSNLF